MFRHFFHHWLRSKAHETVRREVQKAAADHLKKGQAAFDRATDEDHRCEVGFLFALEIEAGSLVDLLKDKVTIRGNEFIVRQGTLSSQRVAVMVSGSGQARARRATEALLEAHQPKWIISAGFAGGLDSRLKRHDIMMADALATPDGRRLALDLKCDPGKLAKGIHVGTLLTTEKVVHRPEDKHALGQQTGALAVDTESMAVAEICRDRHVPMLSARILTDGVDDTLPDDVQHLTDQTSLAGQLGAALGTVWRRPKSVKDLWALKETALVGSDRLAKLLADMVERLSD